MASVLGRDQWNFRRCIVNFKNWFATATDKIAESELPTLRNELENHFLDSIAAHLQAGRPRFEAERQAMLELGDPELAARGFASTHLTKRDWQRIHSPPLGSRVFSLVFVVLWWSVWEGVMPGILPVFSEGNTVALSILAIGNVVNIAVQVLLLLAYLQRQHLNPFQLRLSTTLLEGILFLGGLLVCILPPFNMPTWIFWMVTSLTTLVYYTSEIPLLRKLRARA
jgi:hypothetical protein